MKSFLLFLKQINQSYKIQFVLVLIFGLLNAVFQGIGVLLIIPLLEIYANEGGSNFWLIQFVQQLGSFKDLTFLLSIYFFLILFVALFKGGYAYFSSYVTSRLSAEYAVDAFGAILRADWSFYIKHPPSRLVNLFKTESRAIRGLTMFFFKLVLSGIMIVIQLSLAFLVSWKLTLASVLILGALYLIQTLFFSKNRNLGTKRIRINEQLQQLITEVFQSVKFLKLHHQTRKKDEEFRNIHFDEMHNQLNKVKLDVFSDIVFQIMGAIVIIGMVYFGLTNQWVTTSSILVLLILLNRTLGQVQSFTKSFQFFYNQLPSFEKFHQLVSEANKIPQNSALNNKKDSVQEVTWKHVTFSYDRSVLIKNQNYNFQKGKMYLLFGPSGSGKTTTLDLISGLLKPQQGSIHPNFIPKFSYVLQETVLFAGTIKNNITLGEQFSDDEIVNVVQKVGLENKMNALENGLNSPIRENASNFSGGEKQRLALARALITNPDVLLLDEFTSALDAPTESEIMANLQELKKDRIIIIVSHRERTKDWVDEVIDFTITH